MKRNLYIKAIIQQVGIDKVNKILQKFENRRKQSLKIFDKK